MNSQASEDAASWAKEVSAFLVVVPWLEQALGGKPWNFELAIVCWALGATFFVWASELRAGQTGYIVIRRVVGAFVLTTLLTGVTSILFELAGGALNLKKSGKFVLDLLCAAVATVLTAGVCWWFLQRPANQRTNSA
jgi:hypothetical protein